MKKGMIKKILATALVSMFVVNGLTITKVDARTDDNKSENVLVNLNPIPRNLEVKEGKLTLTKTVNVKGMEVADKDAVKILSEFLEENEIEINNEYNDNSTTLIIGEVEDEISEMDSEKARLGVANAKDLKGEGYVLATDRSGFGTILIEGKDGDGTFYGVKTLTQLVSKNESEISAPEVIISDEPTMGYRGIVEGFYGNPWTHQDRLNQIEFYGENKMNTYIYAPKDDPYHRTKWREPYPESEMNRMSELIETAKKNKVDFVFAISPGIDIRFDGIAGEEDFQALLNKCESLYQMGVRSFAIYFDDINDKSGVKQANLLNRFNNEFVKAKADVKPLITVPTEYDTTAMGRVGSLSKYTSDFSNTLDKDILVMWTGPVVVSEGIDLENAQFVNEVYGKRMGIWWNYPVTDYMKTKLALGPIYGADKKLEGEIDFFTMNPMEHAELSVITLSTGADYSWNTAEYDYQESWLKSIRNNFGDLANEMTTFANHSTRMEGSWCSTGRGDAPDVRAIMDRLWSKLLNSQDASEEINALYEEFDNMIKVADKLTVELPADILYECKSNLAKLKLLGEFDKIALDMMIAEKSGNSEEAARLRNEINSNMYRLKSGTQVSEKTALAFINEALTYDPYIIDPLSAKATASSEEVSGENAPASNFSDNKVGTFWHTKWSGDNPPTSGHWMGLELDKEYTINKVRYVPRQDTSNNGTVTGYKLHVSLDGVNYTKVKEGTLAANKDYKFLEFEPIKAKYIKLEITNTVSDQAGKQGHFATAAELNAYKVISEEEVQAGVSTINTPEVIKVNNIVPVALGVGDLREDIEGYAVEYTFTYNPDAFEYIGVEGAKDGIYAVGSKVKDGEVRVIASSLGNKIESGTDLVNVNLKAKKASEKETLTIASSTIGNGEGNIFELGGATKDVKIAEEDKPVEIIVSKVSNLKCENITSSNVTLSWDAPITKEGLVEYVIYKDGKMVTSISKDSTSYEVEGLKANTIYGFKVTAKYSNAEESKPQSINIRTKK